MNRRQGIILFAAFVLYLVLGATVFRSLENNADIPAPGSEIVAVSEFRDFLINNASDAGLELDDWENLVTTAYHSYIEHVHHNVTQRYWTFYDGFFFCLTVVTTIGYGNLCPITSGGRIFCIFYALFGIPMAGILLAAIGDFFSAKLVAAHEKSRQHSNHPRLAFAFHTINYLIPGCLLFMFLPATIFMALEDWTYLDSFYYCIITLTTVGFGDYVAGTNENDYQWLYKVGIMCWIVFGLGYLSTILNFITKVMKSKHVKKIEKTVSRNLRHTQLAFNKELAGFMRQMNDFYANKLKMKAFVEKSQGGLKRTSSCPSIAADHDEIRPNLKRSTSAGSMADELYADQAESPANFIFELALVMAYGATEKESEGAKQKDASSLSSRKNSMAQLKSLFSPSAAASTTSTSKKRNSIAMGMQQHQHHQHYLGNNMTSVFRNLQLGVGAKNEQGKMMSSSSLFDNFAFSSFGSSRRSNRNIMTDAGRPSMVQQNGGVSGGGIADIRRRSLSHPEDTQLDQLQSRNLSIARLQKEVDNMVSNCRWFIGSDVSSDDDSGEPSTLKSKEASTTAATAAAATAVTAENVVPIDSKEAVVLPTGSVPTITLDYCPRHEVNEVIVEECFDSTSVRSSPRSSTTGSTGDVSIVIENTTTCDSAV